MSRNIEHESYKDVGAFLKAHEKSLLKHAVENNVILGLCYRMQSDPKASKGFRFGAFGYSIYMLTQQNLCLAHGFDPVYAPKLAEIARDWPVPGVVGAYKGVEAFSAAWGKAVEKRLELIVHKLTDVNPVKGVKGHSRLAEIEEAVFIADWIEDFIKDSGVPSTAGPDKKKHMAKAENMIADKAVYLWCDSLGQPVSMAMRSREIGDIANVSYVYTPKDLRGNGYASAVVAALSHDLLESGRSACCLFTDADNPTSNKIYANIGYKPVCRSRHDVFRD